MRFPAAAPLRPVTRALSELDERRLWLADHGVSRQVVGSWLDANGDDLDPEPGRRWAALVNDVLAEWCAGSGGLLAALATVHPADPHSAARELVRAVRELGLVGVMVSTHHRYGALAVDGWEPFWEVAAAEGLPVFVHPALARAGAACWPPAPNQPSERCGVARWTRRSWRPSSSSRACSSAIRASALCSPTAADTFQYQAARINAVSRERRRTARGSRAALAARFYYDTSLLGRAGIRLLVNTVGT